MKNLWNRGTRRACLPIVAASMLSACAVGTMATYTQAPIGTGGSVGFDDPGNFDQAGPGFVATNGNSILPIGSRTSDGDAAAASNASVAIDPSATLAPSGTSASVTAAVGNLASSSVQVSAESNSGLSLTSPGISASSGLSQSDTSLAAGLGQTSGSLVVGAAQAPGSIAPGATLSTRGGVLSGAAGGISTIATTVGSAANSLVVTTSLTNHGLCNPRLMRC